MSDTIDDRIQMLETQVEGLMGHGKAMEYALRLSLLCPARPEALADAWKDMLPALLGAHQERSNLFNSKLRNTLQMLDEHISLGGRGI